MLGTFRLPRRLSSRSRSRSASPISLKSSTVCTSSPTSIPLSSSQMPSTETDIERWTHMLSLQRQYHCYNSARITAAVEALERGYGIEDLVMPTRFCLDLLNEELEGRVRAMEEGV